VKNKALALLQAEDPSATMRDVEMEMTGEEAANRDEGKKLNVEIDEGKRERSDLIKDIPRRPWRPCARR